MRARVVRWLGCLLVVVVVVVRACAACVCLCLCVLRVVVSCARPCVWSLCVPVRVLWSALQQAVVQQAVRRVQSVQQAV